MSLHGRGLCKANFAVTVKTIMPHVLAPATNPDVVFPSLMCRLYIEPAHQHLTSDLTMPIYFGIFNITHLQHNSDGPETKVRSQVASASRTWFVEPQIPPGHRRTVSDSRVFRSSRFGASQIRDAAPSSNRGTSGQPIGECLRVLAPFLLPGAGGLPARRTPGTHAAEARTEAGTQAHRRSARFPAPGTPARSILACGGSELARPGQVRHQRSSAQHRACLGAESKKNDGSKILTPSVASEGFVARYEQFAKWCAEPQQRQRLRTRLVPPPRDDCLDDARVFLRSAGNADSISHSLPSRQPSAVRCALPSDFDSGGNHS